MIVHRKDRPKGHLKLKKNSHKKYFWIKYPKDQIVGSTQGRQEKKFRKEKILEKSFSQKVIPLIV